MKFLEWVGLKNVSSLEWMGYARTSRMVRVLNKFLNGWGLQKFLDFVEFEEISRMDWKGRTRMVWA